MWDSVSIHSPSEISVGTSRAISIRPYGQVSCAPVGRWSLWVLNLSGFPPYKEVNKQDYYEAVWLFEDAQRRCPGGRCPGKMPREDALGLGGEIMTWSVVMLLAAA